MGLIRGIYGICDTGFTPGRSHLDLAEGLLAGGVKILQLRMKGARDLQAVARTAAAILRLKETYDFTFILNDYVELAKELAVDGIHVGADDMPVARVKDLVGEKLLVGYSSHSEAEAKAAQAAGADYVALGAVFPTATKGPGHPVVGVATLEKVVNALTVPVVAIGGIGRDNFSEVAATGVNAIAMISALVAQASIPEAARYFCDAFAEQGRPRR